MMPKHIGRCEGNDEVVTQRARLLEKLEVASMEDVITSRNEDFFHAMKFGLVLKDCRIQ
jgi:hypothetical protein